MERLAYSINETARVLSLGRTSIYAMIADGRLEAFKLGRRTLIKAESVRRLVDMPKPAAGRATDGRG
jgi:excisionase family DNA binding protein